MGDLVEKAVDNRGKTPPTVEHSKYPLLEVASLGNLYPDYLCISKFVDEETYFNWFRAHIKKHDILFSTVGNTGLTSLMDDFFGATIAQNIVAFRAINDNDPEFLATMLQHPDNIKNTKKIEMGAVQPSIKVSQLIHVKYIVSLNINEQKQIGALFTNLDNLITLHQRE